jgi:penicillin-binding protein 1A
MEMNSAYSSFANGGEYIQPTSYTKVYDAGGKILINKTPERNQAFSEETAFIMTRLLKGVMDMGTAAGYGISGIDTCGKTGSTDDNMDRWFAGFTPYYVGTVWVGYDEQKVISYGGVNPALTIWHNVMRRVHENYESKTFDQPIGVDKVYTCSNTGEFGTSRCSGTTDFVNTRLMTGYCSGVHDNVIGTPGVWNPEPVEEDKDAEESGADGDTASDNENSGTGGEVVSDSSENSSQTSSDTTADVVTAE